MMTLNSQMTAQTVMLSNQRDRPEHLTREIGGSIRALEGEGNERIVELSFSSEEPYPFYGNEILDHSEEAVNLDRLKQIGCVLFNHNRNYVVGKILDVWIEDGRCKAKIEFDSDEASELIFQKAVKSGSLKGVSVAYVVYKYEKVDSGETSKDGRFAGPCMVAKKWEPLEISIVSVPADATVGVGRAFEAQNQHKPESLALYEAQIQINKNLIGGM